MFVCLFYQPRLTKTQESKAQTHPSLSMTQKRNFKRKAAGPAEMTLRKVISYSSQLKPVVARCVHLRLKAVLSRGLPGWAEHVIRKSELRQAGRRQDCSRTCYRTSAVTEPNTKLSGSVPLTSLKVCGPLGCFLNKSR